MNLRSITLTALCPLWLMAQPAEIPITSEIKNVTVYTIGAQVSRTAKVELTKGINVLAFEDLSPILDEKSLQFNAGEGTTILSMNYMVRFDKTSQLKKDKSAQLNTTLKNLGEELKKRKDLLAVSVNEEQVLMNNTDFDVWEDMTVAQLEQGVEFVKVRLTEIKKRRQDLYRKVDEINLKRQKITNELQELRIADAKPKGVILVKLKTDLSKTVDAEISYVVADAGWEPYYDLRVKNVSSPLKIEYKAKVRQNTGEDWSQVNLVLSTGNPYEEGSLPQLETWFLNYISGGYYQQNTKPTTPQTPGITGTFKGVVLDTKTGEAIPFANVVALNQKRNILSGTTSGADGNFSLEVASPATYLEVSFIGYNRYSQAISNEDQFYTIRLSEAAEKLEEVVVMYEAPEPSQNTRLIEQEDIAYMAVRDIAGVATQASGVFSDQGGRVTVRGARPEGNIFMVDGVKVRGQSSFKISRNSVNLKFEVDIPYDIPSDGEHYKVAIIEYNREVDYLYRAVPKLNEHAFLTASLIGWEDLKLMNGSGGIYFEDTYLGETYLNVEEAGDTLQMSLGKDENIKVLRKAIAQKEGNNFLGGKRVDKFHYEIKVRNNKAIPLRIEISDQYPISANDKIEVERKEHSGGKVNSDTGIITWEFVLPPREEKKLDLKYEIKYEKGKQINIR